MKLKYDARIISRNNILNLIYKFMEIMEFAQFRPATQSKDFDADYKEFDKMRKAFLEMVQEALTEDRIFKVTRTNYGKALESILDPESPILTEIKNGFIELSFVVKLK